MRKPIKFVVELVLVAIFVGWLLMKASEHIDPFIPLIVAAIGWYLSYEYLWNTEMGRSWRDYAGISTKKLFIIKVLLSFLVCCSFWFLGEQVVVLVNQKATLAPSVQSSEVLKADTPPHLSAKLTMSVYQKGVALPRLEVTNIGDVAIGSILSAIDTGDGSGFDGVPTQAQLQPKAPMAIDFLPVYGKPKSSIISFVLVYQTLLGDKSAHYSRFKFFVTDKDIGDELYPTYIDEGQGDLGYGSQLNRMVEDVFNQTTGTFVTTAINCSWSIK